MKAWIALGAVTVVWALLVYLGVRAANKEMSKITGRKQ